MNARKITEGALTVALYIVLLLMFLYLPFFGIVFSFVLPLPFIYHTAKYNWKDGLLQFLAAVVLSFLVGTVAAVPVTFIYGLFGVVTGWCIYDQRDRFITFSSSTLTFIVTTIIVYAVSVLFFDINYLQEFKTAMEESVREAVSVMELMGRDTGEITGQINDYIDLITTLLPSVIILASAVIALLIHAISFPVLRRFGIDVLKARPFREITLPKSLIWYYLAALLLSLFVNAEKGTFLYDVSVNLLYILEMLFVLQGLTFIFYFFHKKGYHRALAVVLSVFIILNPLLNQLTRILGIIDLGFDLRKRVQPKQ